MSFTTPPQHGPAGLGFTNDTTKLRAEWLNYVGGNFSKALDAIGGGYYQFTSDIRLSCDTAQFKVNAPAAADPIALLGYVTIGVSDDANYAVGVGTLTVSSAATFSTATTFSSTVTLNGAVTFNTGSVSGDVKLASRSVVRSIDDMPSVIETEWQTAATGRIITLVNTGIIAVYPLNLPHGSTLTALSVSFVGAGGHAGLPGTMPTVTIYKTDLATGVDTTIATASDGSGTTGAFQAVHAFGPSGLSEVIDRTTNKYSVAVNSEFGVNALSGAVCFGLSVTGTFTRLDEF